ncbi:hypothetical protein VCUG_00809 [Vavraia culicis subsp. floridensis]|uniref:Uncharacterized protein n=1 Tax=Vavraia culicis (isolate floridensis) TaxID=948595 RepID=L2GWI9_VAVCU|nr:uncharacterized protein VCUG_00809 [Vavraia culicis subsp. floridensis]ELA47727.1 hypothetical protein VCUG_00809 [Vavraia culicis subsp. floridensis]
MWRSICLSFSFGTSIISRIEHIMLIRSTQIRTYGKNDNKTRKLQIYPKMLLRNCKNGQKDQQTYRTEYEHIFILTNYLIQTRTLTDRDNIKTIHIYFVVRICLRKPFLNT